MVSLNEMPFSRILTSNPISVLCSTIELSINKKLYTNIKKGLFQLNPIPSTPVPSPSYIFLLEQNLLSFKTQYTRYHEIVFCWKPCLPFLPPQVLIWSVLQHTLSVIVLWLHFISPIRWVISWALKHSLSD